MCETKRFGCNFFKEQRISSKIDLVLMLEHAMHGTDITDPRV